MMGVRTGPGRCHDQDFLEIDSSTTKGAHMDVDDTNRTSHDQGDDVNEAATVSRRAMIGGLGAAGAIGLAGAFGGATHVMAVGDTPAAIDAPTDGLVYLPLDAFAFDVARTSSGPYRLYQTLTGMQPSDAPNEIYASLPIPIGSVVKKINVAYIGTPIIAITRRVFGTQTLTDAMTLVSLPAQTNPASTTVTIPDGGVVFTPGATYAMKVFCSVGQSVFGMEVGYIPAAQAFIPFTGSEARIFDSRSGARFNPNEERTIDLSPKLIATARATVLNITATSTAGPGFLAAFADGIAYPNNSSVNFSSANLTVANGVICPMTAGKIKVRCGPAATHVIVDVIGSLL